MSEPVDLVNLAGELETLRVARANIAKWREVENLARERIQEALGDAEAGEIDGRVVVTWKKAEQVRVDVKALRAVLPPSILDPYLTSTPTRRFNLKDE